MRNQKPRIEVDVQNKQISCHGNWTIRSIVQLENQWAENSKIKPGSWTIDGNALNQLDSAGGLFLSNMVNQLKQNGSVTELKTFSQEQQDLLALIREKQDFIDYKPKAPKKESPFYHLGVETIKKLGQGQSLLIMVGDLTEKIIKAAQHVRRFHAPSIISTIYSTGVTALPIIGLLSFLIGVVLAYQMGLQLETYGANIFIAYISGMAIFREFSPLITAIIVAGRTSSAFTAQLGSMRINEEIDALNTMGISPTELLVLPRVIGLLIVFPLLIFWSVLFATLGAMYMSKVMLDVSYMDFLSRIQQSVGMKQLALGLYKAPAFAILIAVVGCLQGLLVEANADSIGRQTTKSVVQALFLIIIADAIYSIIYSWIKV